MATDYEVRLAGEGDVIGIVYVQATSWIKNYSDSVQDITTDDLRSVDFNSKTNEWRHILRSPSYRVWVAARGRIILGFIAARLGEVYEQHTLPEEQRRGIGTVLFKAAGLWMGKEAVLLRIPIHASGVDFYKQLGFSIFEEGEVDFIRLPSGKQITTIVMRRPPPAVEMPPEAPAAPAILAKSAPLQAGLISRAKLAQVSGSRPSTIKFYTEIGILPFEQAEARLARRYQPEQALARLKQIKQLQAQGLSVSQIKQQLSNEV